MEFLDNSGHIFSLTSYNQKPIGYEYDENPYVFYMNDDKQYRLSINNYYIRTIYALYPISSDIDLDKFEIDIYFNNTNIYKLISPIKFQEKISNLKDLSDSVEFDLDDDEIIKTTLNKDDLYCIETTDTINNIDYTYYLIPIYVLSYSDEEGTWLSNLMIHINDNEYHTYCPITIGAVYVDEYEELIINGKNMGVSLPKDIIKAIYSESIYNSEFNLELYNKKLKEYLINYTSIKHELGNYNSVINSLKWFGYGNKIILSKLIKTDNDIMNQYIRDYFNIEGDILKSFSKFKNDSLLSLMMMTNKELDETYDIDTSTGWMLGENKPKLYSLLDNYELIKINNHDLPIENDKDKYFYWKPYFDFSFNELCIKLTLLKHYFKKYFLPIHLNIHTASLGEKVFMNDIKMTSNAVIGVSSPLICTYLKDYEIEFTGNGIHYYTKQIHYIDDNFNEFTSEYMENNYNDVFYELNDTCISIPIKFKDNKLYNCILILERYDEVLYESHFSFYNENNSYKNFVIYPKKINIKNYIESNAFEYWINSEFNIKLCVNNKWYDYHFKTKISKPIIDFGKLRYKYKFNNLNDLLGYKLENDNLKHSILMINNEDTKCNLNNNANVIKDYDFEILYDIYNLDDSKSVVLPFNSNIESYNGVIDYSNYSKFTQIESITNEKVNFNAYMNNHKLAESNNINFDIDFYKILKYHLNNNLQYIDGALINDQFYTYFNFYVIINNDDPRIQSFFSEDKNKLFGFDIYKHKENNYYSKLIVKPSKNTGYDLFDDNGKFICKWTNDLKLYLKYEIYLHKDLIGQPIELHNTYISNLYSNLIYAHDAKTYILRETDTNSNIFEILNENTASVIGEEYDDVFGLLLLESYNFEYDNINNRYYKISYDENNEEIITTYELCDKLFKNTDEYYLNYNYTPNIIYSDRYLNVMHLFGIYKRNYKLNNVLSFNQDVDINVNGINFKYVNKYLDEYTNEELSLIEENNISSHNVYTDKFYVSGTVYRDYIEADTRYPDVYGLYWEHYLKDENNNPYLQLQYKTDYKEYQNYGLYVKRQYDPNRNEYEYLELDNDYFETSEEVINYNNSLPGAISIDDYKIPHSNTSPGIKYTMEEVIEYNSKLPGAVKIYDSSTPKHTATHTEYITFDEFYYYEEQTYSNLGEFRFETLDDFKSGIYNKEYIPKDFYGELIYSEIDDKHIYQWVDTKLYDVTRNMQPHVYDLNYKIYAKHKNDNELTSISPGDIYTNDYEYLIVKFVYKKVILVKNKYYSLVDYLENKLGAIKKDGKYFINNKEVTIMYSTDENYKEYNESLPGAYNLNTKAYYTDEEVNNYNSIRGLNKKDKEYLWTVAEATEYNKEVDAYYNGEIEDEYGNEYVFDFDTETPEYLNIENVISCLFKGYENTITKYYDENNAPAKNLIGTPYTETIYISEEEYNEHNMSLPGAHDYIEGHNNVLVAVYYSEGINGEHYTEEEISEALVSYITDNVANLTLDEQSVWLSNHPAYNKTTKDWKIYPIEPVRQAIDIIKVNDSKRYLDVFNQEVKIQNPSGYWVNVDDNGKIHDVPQAYNELKRYWFKENEDNTVGDTMEEIRNSLEIYKQKLEKLKSYDDHGKLIILPEYGLNQKDNIELRYRYRNYLSKYITGLKGKFKISWSYVDANGNIDISDVLTEDVKIFNLCVCVTNEDDSINIYSTNGQEFELSGNEKEVVVYFRLNTIDKPGQITPFYVKPKLIAITEVQERLKYNYKESGNEVKVNIGNKTYSYGDNSSEYVINLYNMFFTNTWNLYDVYPIHKIDDEYTFKPRLMHKIYETNKNIQITKNNLYDFYLMHDNEYWYGLYISKYTCDNINLSNIRLENEDKIKYLNNIIMMKYERSSKEFLINRMEYISSNGINHFMNDDIICTYLVNNDRLPIRTDISSKWRISPMSLGMNKTSDFESNAEMTIVSLPYNDNKYQSGYYKATVRYSLDRDLQHQFKDSATFMVI